MKEKTNFFNAECSPLIPLLALKEKQGKSNGQRRGIVRDVVEGKRHLIPT